VWAGVGERKEWAVGRKARARPKLGFLFFFFSIFHFFFKCYFSNMNLYTDAKVQECQHDMHNLAAYLLLVICFFRYTVHM
jgi:hypothetical protein